MDTVIIGSQDNPILTFDGEKIRQITLLSNVDVVGAELSIDQTYVTVDYSYTSYSGEVVGGLDFDGIASSDGYILATSKTFVDLRQIPYGTVLYYFVDS